MFTGIETNKLIKLSLFSLFALMALMVHMPKAAAECALQTGGSNAFEGAIVVTDAQLPNGGGLVQTNVPVAVEEAGKYGINYTTSVNGNGQSIPPYNIHTNVDQVEYNQTWPYDIVNGVEATSNNYAVFGQVPTGWANGTSGGASCQTEAFGHSSAVILGSTDGSYTSSCESNCGNVVNNNNGWNLDCGTLYGQAQTFEYFIPNINYSNYGLPSGGYWVAEYIDGNNTYQKGISQSSPVVGATGSNGTSDYIKLVYIEPTPSNPKPVNSGGSLSCTSFDWTNGSVVVGGVTYYTFAVFTISGGNVTGENGYNLLSDENPSGTGYVPNNGDFNGADEWENMHAGLSPSGSGGITVTVNVYYSHLGLQSVPSQSGTLTSANPCYNAQCSAVIDSGLPDGTVNGESSVPIYVTVWNDDADGLPFPNYTGIGETAGNYDVWQAVGALGVGGPYGGYQLYGTLPPGGSPGGTINITMYSTSIGGAFGGTCPVTVNPYQPPSISAAAVCVGNAQNPGIMGQATDPYTSSYGLTVLVTWEDSQGNTGQVINPATGNNTFYTTDDNGDFSIPSTDYPNLQNGLDTTITVVVVDPYGIQNGSNTAQFTGCEQFNVSLNTTGQLLHCDPTYAQCTEDDEDPNAYGAVNPNTDVATNITYGPSGTNTYYGPSTTTYPNWCGIPDTNLTPSGLTESYFYTLNGVHSGPSGPVPANGALHSDGTNCINYYSGAPYNYLAQLYEGITPAAGDSYCLDGNFNIASGFIDRYGNILTANPAVPPNPACGSINNKPFFKVYNGGVSTGSSFNSLSGSSSADCPGGLIGSWNNTAYNSNNGNDYGSGTTFTGLGDGPIIGFGSYQNSTQNTNGPPTALSMTNDNLGGNPTDIDSPAQGGNAGDTDECLDQLGSNDYTKDTNTTESISNLESSGSVQNEVFGDDLRRADQVNLVLNGGQLNLGDNMQLTVYGNVYITSNIYYDQNTGGGGWQISPSGTNPSSNIPFFSLSVIGGNIYIDPSVNELDGVYSAKPDVPPYNGGTIYTCGYHNAGFTSFHQYYSTLSGPLSQYNSCNAQLTVYGVFQANKIDLMRTYGSLRDDQTSNDSTGTPTCSNPPSGNPLGSRTPPSTPILSPQTCAAEVFYLSPELYLSGTDLTGNPGASNTVPSWFSNEPPIL